MSNLGLASGCFMLNCCLTSSVRLRKPLSRLSESNLSALFMAPVLIKCTKVLLIYSSFPLFSAFSVLLYICLKMRLLFSLSKVLFSLTNALCWWCLKDYLKTSVVVSSEVSSFTNCLTALFDGRWKIIFFQKRFARMPYIQFFHTLQMALCWLYLCYFEEF